MDTMYPNPEEKHKSILKNMIPAIDTMLNVHDPQWELGTMGSWGRQLVELMNNTDNHSCGVLMLGWIKSSAARIVSRYGMVSGFVFSPHIYMVAYKLLLLITIHSSL
ncbi:uncharacterized protein [Spinacia oleracea]|uniref:Ubiquitin-like protease family profile domain-containing protein n=1 Tax=Spinacia oleracea TaxID=3562 RepID=A0ABM3QPN3_SPIOL|nr:uncharacterized protein LOC130461308 [Spinacia oleracea]